MLGSNAPTDTLAGTLNASFLTRAVDMKKMTIAEIHDRVSSAPAYYGHKVDPLLFAAEFYVMNQAVARIKSRRELLEPLTGAEQDMVVTYRRRASEIASRLFDYVLMIIIREARHMGGSHVSDSTHKKIAKELEAKGYGDVAMATIATIQDQLANSFSSDSLTTMKHSHANRDLGLLVAHIEAGYRVGPWGGGSYGGKKWGVIADTLWKCVSGEWSLELFADTAFTLAHNTCTIFNKGMLFHTPDTTQLTKLLDCQRAGQVPQFLVETGKKEWLAQPSIKMAREIIPDLFEQPVDWALVDQFGVGNYKHQAQVQKEKSGAPLKVGEVVQVDALMTLSVKEPSR